MDYFLVVIYYLQDLYDLFVLKNSWQFPLE